jgi:hypothetical protein
MTSHGTNAFFGNYQPRHTVEWFTANTPALANALTLTYLYGTVYGRDVEGEFSAYGVLWGYYQTAADFNYAGNDVEIVWAGISYPYGSANYSYWNINWGPLDETPGGSLDGEVSDNESYRVAIDSSPQGLTGGRDIIHYYMEGSPDDSTIEVIANVKSSLGSMDYVITTIDETNFIGEPIDISVMKTYPSISIATGNWLMVLEDNGDSTWQVAVFTQDGVLIGRGPTLDGDALVLDCDSTAITTHVWANVSGTLRYYIFQYVE